MDHRWENFSWKDIEKLEKEKSVVVLPTGAIEQHGHHLPLSTDTKIISSVVDRVRELLPEECPVYFLPVLPYGKSNEHADFPGTITLDHQSHYLICTHILESVIRSGFRKILILNSHGGNRPTLEIVARDIRQKYKIIIGLTIWSSFTEPEDIKIHDIHAGEFETSIMLHCDTDNVKMNNLQPSVITSSIQWNNNYQYIGYWDKPVHLGWVMNDIDTSGTASYAEKAEKKRGKEMFNNACYKITEMLIQFTTIRIGISQ